MAIFSILFLFLAFGGVALAVLIAAAIMYNRPGLAILVGGGAVVLVLLLVAFAFVGLAVKPHSVSVQATAPAWVGGPMNDAARTAAAQGLQQFKVSVGENSSAISHFSHLGLLTLIGLVFVAVLVARRLFSPRAACGHFKFWPALLAIPLIILVLLAYMRVRMATNIDTAAVEVMPQIAQQMAAQQQAMIARQNAQVAAAQQYQGVIPQSDIHALMDQFDGPRIPVSPQAATPSAEAVAPMIVQPATAAKQSAENTTHSKAKTNDTAKPAADSTHKRKKPAKPPANSDTKTQTVVRSEPATSTQTTSTSTVELEKQQKPSTFRPAWLDEPPRFSGNNPREVISTDEYATVDECYQAADIYLLLKTYQYIQHFAGRPYVDPVRPSISFHSNMIFADGNVISWTDPRLQELNNMGIGTAFVREKIVAKDPGDGEPREYVETTDHSSVGPMKKLYLEVEFTPAIGSELRQRWDAHQRQERFAMVGMGAGSVLALLSLVFALLKIDTWTKGYYSKRLFLGVPMAIIGGLLLISLFIVLL